ncbi:MAG: DNA-directed RNA polymerase subunit omega [Firmicutes bacterium]|nr:DNA-directed RNA polymerase subunit omega [Bacillota bacterium]
MLYPSIDKLLNFVDSKYKLVHVASKRSKQMLENHHLQKKETEYYNKKELGRALEEVEDEMIHLVDLEENN